MNPAQETDYAYHADRLSLLIARRGKLLSDSDQIPALDVELISIEDLVRSYRLVRAHEHRKIAGSALSKAQGSPTPNPQGSRKDPSLNL
jgi:hypothetical protein